MRDRRDHALASPCFPPLMGGGRRAAGPSPRAWRVVAAQFALGPRGPLPLVMAGAVLAWGGRAVHPLERGNVEIAVHE